MKRMLVAIATATLALSACDTGLETEQAAIGEPDVERFCQLSAQLDELGDQELALDLESTTPDPEAVQAEFSDFVDAQSDRLEELQRVAPPEVADDVETFVETIRDVAETGDLSAVDAGSEAEERITEFEEEQCDGES